MLLGLLAGVLVVVLVLGTVVVLDRVRGGASSPTQLADRLTTALGAEDVGALVRLVEPGERAALLRLASAWTQRFDELDLPADVGGRSAGDPLEGLDLTLTGAAPRVEAQSGDVAVVGLPDLAVRVRSTPAEAHDLLRAWFTYRWITDPQEVTYPADGLPGDLAPRFVAVERSGRWYLSLVATLLGPGLAEGNPPVVQRLPPTASASPEAAVEATVRGLVDALVRHDVAPFARSLDASGSDAAQLWAAEVSTAGTTPDARVEEIRVGPGRTDGSRATVRVEDLRITGDSGLTLAGGCATVSEGTTCLRPSGYRFADGVGELSSFALLGHDGTFWLTATRDGDGWRTSLPDSLADALAAYADHLTRAQMLALLRRPTLDEPSGTLTPDVAQDVPFTTAGYALRTLHVERRGLYRLVPSPEGTNRAAIYDVQGQPAIQPYYPNDSVYQLDPGDHRVLVWADDAFSASLAHPETPYVQRVEIRSVR